VGEGGGVGEGGIKWEEGKHSGKLIASGNGSGSNGPFFAVAVLLSIWRRTQSARFSFTERQFINKGKWLGEGGMGNAAAGVG